MLAIYQARIFLDDLSYLLSVECLMIEFYCGGVVVVVLLLYPWKPRKILQLLSRSYDSGFLFVGCCSTDPWVLHIN